MSVPSAGGNEGRQWRRRHGEEAATVAKGEANLGRWLWAPRGHGTLFLHGGRSC